MANEDKSELDERSPAVLTKMDEFAVARKRKPDDGAVNGDQPLPKIPSNSRRSPG